MIPSNLVTNEVKNSAGTEVEFLRQSTNERKLVFAQSGETPNQPHRLTISHQENGSGLELVRRSLIRVDKTVIGASGEPRVVSTYCVTVAPVGDLANTTEIKNTIAECISLIATTGAATTVLFDCTGYGADSLVNGTL